MKARNLATAALLASACFVVGCYESRARQFDPIRDGDAALADGGGLDGSANGVDGGGADARADATTASRDAASACGDVVAPYAGAGCSDATRACIAACPMGDVTCPDECIAREGECSVCVNQTFVSCANGLGCQDAWDAFACCVREEPSCAPSAGLELLACAEGCDAELLQYDACFRALDGAACTAQAITTCGLAM